MAGWPFFVYPSSATPQIQPADRRLHPTHGKKGDKSGLVFGPEHDAVSNSESVIGNRSNSIEAEPCSIE
jgi:hypothetical protein